ncbi:MAG: hypothetical protein D6732_00190 [Methanobacteriota archaeon]|nr:MAG: hypothetical protein D6732_00190 [Euryarchaeota archaeon]
MDTIIVNKDIVDKIYSLPKNGKLRNAKGEDISEELKGYRLYEQNPNKNSVFARYVRDGGRIVWAIPTTGRWLMILESEEDKEKIAKLVA